MSSPSTGANRSAPNSETDRISGSEALGYAVDEYRGLFVVLAIGWLVWQGGGLILSRAFASHSIEFASLVYGGLVLLAGIGIVFVALIATVYKLLLDAGLAAR